MLAVMRANDAVFGKIDRYPVLIGRERGDIVDICESYRRGN